MIRKEFFGGLFGWVPPSRTVRVSLAVAVLSFLASAYMFFSGGMQAEERLFCSVGYLAVSSVAGAVARVTWRW